MLKVIGRVALLCFVVFAAAALGSEQAQTTPETSTRASLPDEEAERLITELSDENYSVREAATTKLIEMGHRALPALAKAETATDAETAWRAAAAGRMIRLGITPQLWATLGDLIEEFEQADATMRERIVRIMRMVGDKESIPALRRIVRSDPSRTVRQTAAIMLADLGSEGLAVLMQEGVEIAGLDPYDAGVHVLIGNSFLGEKKYKKAQQHYTKALELEPDNFIAMYNMACVRSLEKKIDQAIEWLQKAVEAGYDDFEWMEKDTDLDNIREDKRYKEMLRKGPRAPKRPADGAR